jgi:hypothetical protein
MGDALFVPHLLRECLFKLDVFSYEFIQFCKYNLGTLFRNLNKR